MPIKLNIAKQCQLLPNLANCSEVLLNKASYRQIKPITANYSPFYAPLAKQNQL